MTQEEFEQQIEDRDKEILLDRLKKAEISIVGNEEQVVSFLKKLLAEQRQIVASEYMDTTRKKYLMMRTIDIYDYLCDCSFAYMEHLKKKREEKEIENKEKAKYEKLQAIMDAMLLLYGDPCTFGGNLSSFSIKKGWNVENYRYFCELRQTIEKGLK